MRKYMMNGVDMVNTNRNQKDKIKILIIEKKNIIIV